MRIWPPNRLWPHTLNHASSTSSDVAITIRGSQPSKEKDDRDHAKRGTAVRQRPGGLDHWCRAHRFPFKGSDPARVGGAVVAFEPGARTIWHTHPLGQTLIVTSGCGWVQREGAPIEGIRTGDVVWFEPSEKHWHGATATTGMTHIAIAEALDSKVVDWMEHVAGEQYQAR
jgi:quercetin dioxygenase-like cupin family protein